MPILGRIISLLSGDKRELEGPWNMGRWSLPVNLIALLYLVFTSITFNFPTVKPVDSENM